MDCSSNKSGIARNFLEQSTCGKRNKNLQEIIGGHAIKHGKAFRTHLENRHGNSEPCNTNVPSLRSSYDASRSLTLVRSEIII